MATKKMNVKYNGSLFWLIFWLIIFFPIALALFFTGCSYDSNGATHSLKYEGSRFWLCFWILFFFPVAFVLFFIKGFTITSTPEDLK
jgi:ABC-type dipeptide/oligopeptide/nickel transport system permease component